MGKSGCSSCGGCSQKPNLKITKWIDTAIIPEYKKSKDSGFDLHVCLIGLKEEILKKGEIKLFETGLKFELPDGFEVQIRPRSGMASKKGATVINTPGTVDQDYRGKIKIALVNLGPEDIVIKDGDRIAQGVLCPVYQANIIEVDEISSDTDRGEGGFGSTGE